MRMLCRQFLLGFIVALAFTACVPAKPTFKGSDITGVDWGRDVTLQASTGKRVSTAEFRGKVQVLFFGYTHCPDICSPTLAKLVALRKALGPEADAVQVLFITVDPAHDTPAQLAQFLGKFDSTFIGLTGSADDIAAATREHKVPFAAATQASATPQIDHASTLLVKDASGKLRLLWNGELPVEDMAHDVRLLLKQKA